MSAETSVFLEIAKVIAQGGAMAVIAFYTIYKIGEKLDKLTEAVAKLHTKITVLLDREGARVPEPQKRKDYDSEVRL